MSHINVQVAQLKRQFDRVQDAAVVMASPVAWSEVNDLNPVTTWAEGRDDAVKRLRELAQIATDAADYAETIPPYGE